jgi:glycosyltransferase involved in cell wall biosynthesis
VSPSTAATATLSRTELAPKTARRTRRASQPVKATLAAIPFEVVPTGPLAGLRVVHLSFEGPDRYSAAGGLGIRVTTLARAAAALGASVELYFVGDPSMPTQEVQHGVTLHRRCQEISEHAPNGVYDAEEAKIAEMCTVLPAELADSIVADAAIGVRTVVLAEDWHMAWPLIGLHDELVRRDKRDAAHLVWTANNRFGFDRIDFARLNAAATLVTISRAMKHIMWGVGVNPMVVPNGIPADALVAPADTSVATMRSAFAGRTTLSKVGRWDLDKRWMMALEATASLAQAGDKAVLLARGWNGSDASREHYKELRQRADELGLHWVVCDRATTTDAEFVESLADAALEVACVVEIATPVDGSRLKVLYTGCDAVLANSGFEPFGLVGLEAMAAGAIVMTGSTGEDYVQPYRNAFALDTDEPDEIVRCLLWLRAKPERAAMMRSAGSETARNYTWPDVIERLLLAIGITDVM